MLTLTTRARAGRRTREDSHAMVQTLVAIGLLCLTTLALLAAPVPTGKPGNYPAWWFSRNAIAQKNPTNASPTWPTNYPTSDDYAGINQGQLKNLATAAYNELRAQAPTNVWTTPQGTNLTAMVTGWNPASGDAYAGVNLGQLKTVAKPFYDLLMQIGYTGAYPWTGVNADDYAAANIGQAKYAFSFDVTSAPLAVTGLTVTAAVNELDLAWTDPPYNPMENLTVLQSTDGGSTWTAIATLSPGATSFAATNLDPNLSYSYKISSNRNTSGGSAATASTTPAPPISLPRYALIDLGTNMGPVAMNNSNVVVGNSYNGSRYTALMWSQGTNTTLPLGSFTSVEATGIDDSGHIVATGTLAISSGGTTGYTDEVAYWANSASTPSGLGTNVVRPGWSEPYGFASLIPYIGGDGSIVGAVGSTLTSTNLDISGGPIAATFTPGGSPAYLWVGNTWVQPTSKARGHWAGWCDISFFGGNPPDEIDGAVVDGTEYPNLYPYAVNDSGVAVGTDYTNALIIAGTGSGTTLGPGAALALNNATVMSGTNTVAQPQIIGRDASTYPGNPMLWDHTNPDGTTSSTYVGKKINSLCPTHSGWTVTGAAAINNAGCIAGSANYSGTNSAIPQGQHGCLLVPIEFVYETSKGSGNYKVLKKLPIFQPDTGTGETSTTTSTSGLYEVQLSANITTSAVASMYAYFVNASGASFKGTLTETAANSGIFHDSGSTITLTLPVGTTTSSSVVNTLTATVTDSALGLSGVSMTFGETGASSLVFVQPHMDMAVGFPSGGLSTTTVDTITLEYTRYDVATDVTLTETGVNTKIFHSSDGTISLSIVGTPTFNPSVVDTMTVQLTATGLFPGTLTSQLNETGVNTKIFSNFSITYGNNTPVDPGASSDGVFYVRLKGMTLPAGQTMPMSICAGADPAITGSTPTGANYIQSSPLLLVPPGNGSASYSGLTTVSMDAITSLVNIGLYGQTASFNIKAGPTAFLATGALDTVTKAAMPGDSGGPSGHLQALDQIIGRKKYSGMFDWTGTPPVLGYANSVTQTDLTLAKFKSEVGNNHSIFYIFTHGTGEHLIGGGEDNSRFFGFNVWKSGLLWNTPYAVTASDITSSIGSDTYDLVFINGCCSANDSDGVVTAYKNAFNTHAYVGWDVAVTPDTSVPAAVSFFKALAGGKTVTDAAKNIKAVEAPTADSFFLQFAYGQTQLDAATDDGIIIDRNALPPNDSP